MNYKDFYGTDQPVNAMDLLKGFDKATILTEFAGLNYRLKPKTMMYYDTSLEMQIKLLRYFCGDNEHQFKKTYPLFARYIISENDYPLIFTRQTSLYAMEQIIHSDLLSEEGFSMREAWPRMLQYLLTVNTEITKQTNQPSEKPLSLEELSPRMLPLNELSLDINPLYTPYRGYHLLQFFAMHDQLGEHFAVYFKSEYGIPYDQFVYEQMSMAYSNNKDHKNDIISEMTGEKLDTSFHYSVKQKDQALFNALSKVYPSEKTERLISIRKFPFFKVKDSAYVLIDTTMLLEKSYSQFINDFWFDCVKMISGADGKPMYPIRYYRGEIGKFVESYTKGILEHSFKNAKYYTVKLFEDLKLNVSGDEIELTDVYIRYNRKIFLAEVKATGLYDDEKYSGDIKTMYKDNREGFFQSFGVDQLVNAIRDLTKKLPAIDKGFDISGRYHIYPGIIVNERALQTPIMAHIFNQRFQELLEEITLDNLKVHPVSVMHISDLENMEDCLHQEPGEFWRLLRYNVREPAFIPPFYNSVNRRDIRPNFSKSKRLFEELVLKYQHKPI